MPRHPGSSSQLNLKAAVERFPVDRPSLLVTLLSTLNTAEGLADMTMLRKAVFAEEPEFLETECILVAVTRGLCHVLMTNGQLKEDSFIRGRIEKPFIRHADDRAGQVKQLLDKYWPTISGITKPCILDQDKNGYTLRHGPYLATLPLIKESHSQRNWAWWVRA